MNKSKISDGHTSLRELEYSHIFHETRESSVSEKRLDSFKTRRQLKVGSKTYDYFSLKAAASAGIGDVDNLPFSLKALLS